MDTITKVDDEHLQRGGFAWLADERTGVRALSCTALAQRGFANLFSTRTGGVSPMPSDALNLAGFTDDAAENIHENRRRFLALLDDDGTGWRLATAWQVHGADIVRVRHVADEASDAHAGVYVNDSVRCDALSTDAPGVLVAAKSADCVPVLLADEHTGACAAVHAGWRGTLAGVVGRSLAHMKSEYGTRGENVIACIGPAAAGCCYEVGADVVDAFRSQYEETFFIPTREGHARIDLHAANRSQLVRAGVAPGNIYVAPFCTMHDNDRFFSYRLEKERAEPVGRSLAVIGRGK